jgi:hypothetical protein
MPDRGFLRLSISHAVHFSYSQSKFETLGGMRVNADTRLGSKTDAEIGL